MLHLTDSIQFMRSMPSCSVDCIATDPPYRTISGGKNRAEGYGLANSVVGLNDGKIFKHNDAPISEWMPELYRVLRDGGHCYVMTNVLNLREMLNEANDAGFGLHNLLVWKKNTGTPNRWYMKFAEYTLFLRKGPARTINRAGSSNVFEAPNPLCLECPAFNSDDATVFEAPNPRDKSHPTEKPVDLFREYILNSTDEGDTVFDPFAGSGATLVAAEQTGRKWIGCEIDPLYYYPALARVMREQQR